MEYPKREAMQGVWLDKSSIVNGTKAKLVSETKPQEGEYGTQDIAKISIDGESETKNVRLNKPTINALGDAYGTESKEWINKPLTLQTEEMRVAGKKVTALYLIPEGYELTDNEDGYLVVVPKKEDIPVVDEKEEIPVIEEDPFA